MGFRKDIRTLKTKTQAKGASNLADPARATGNGLAPRPASNHQVVQMHGASSASSGDAGETSAQVLPLGRSNGGCANDPVDPVELTILYPDDPPRPASTSVVVPLTQVHRLATGATVPVERSASNSDGRAIDWSAPA